MATTLGDATDAATPAQRVRRPGWRDPRLWIGVVLVAGSVVAGARLLAAADDTVQVWAAATDLGAGARLTEEDLVATRVRFADEDTQAGYYTVDDELPADLQLVHGLGAGELVPRAAVGSAARQRAGRGADRGRARAGAVVRRRPGRSSTSTSSPPPTPRPR